MKKTFSPLVTALALACQCAIAQPVATGGPVNEALRETTQKALTSNPEVTARLNAFRAAEEDVAATRGGFLPRVDLSAEGGKTRDRISSRSPQDLSLSTTGLAISATQLLWDGLSTHNQVQQFDHVRLSRYFEFLNASELMALEAVNAYLDVSRSRALVKLAEDNYVQHRQVVEQIQSRVKAGVSRGVDLEQSAARLALAESNLSNETSNLHDITERYQRVVGSQPPAVLSLPQGLDNGLPGNASAMLDTAIRRNTAIAAAVENYRAAQSQSAYQPKVQAQIRAGAGHNFDGVQDQKRDTSATLSLNWNLFNGGSDRARVRQAAALLSQAADQRDKVCRDTRQTAAIAFNDSRKLLEQISALDRNALATEKARDAYRQQFDIGQRSLLDVLNAENELFTARRSLANARHDLLLAQARSHAASSNLVRTLGLTRAGSADEGDEVRNWSAGEEAASRCPLIPTTLPLATRKELDDRALTQTLSSRSTPALSAVTPLDLAAAAPQPPAPQATPGTPLTQRLLDWSQAWRSKDVAGYVAFYDPSFKPEVGTRAQWLSKRTALVRQEGPVELTLSNVQRKPLSPSLVEVSFDQAYSAGKVQDNSQKTQTWRRVGKDWLIVREISR